MAGHSEHALHWLKSWTDNELVPLAEAFANILYPNRQWEVIGAEPYEIVVDRDRTLVFDLTNFEKYSAGVSLIFAQDESYEADEMDQHTALKIHQLEVDRYNSRFAMARRHFDAPVEGQVLNIRSDNSSATQ